MDDLKIRIKALLEEIELTYLKKTWPEQLVASGINEVEAHTWAAEIGHVLEAYQSSLTYLVDLLQETRPDRIPQQANDWADYSRDITVFKIEDSMRYLQERLEKYLPPESSEEDEPPS